MADNALMAGRRGRNALLDAPYSYPISEYTTEDEMRQERISQALGWDTSRPGQELLRRALTILPLVVRSPVGARIANDVVWAAQTPSAITGGRPSYHLYGRTDADVPNIGLAGRPVSDSSVGLISRNPAVFERRRLNGPRDITREITYYGPRGPANDWRP